MRGLPPQNEKDKRDKRGGRGRSRSRTPRRAEQKSSVQSPTAVNPGTRARQGKNKLVDPTSDSDQAEKAPKMPKPRVKLYKMGEFCCNIVANFVKGKDTPDPLTNKLHIDQRTKIDHCKSHLDRAGDLATIWHFSAADRKDCAAYDALCDYFVEKQRVGLVQTPSCYVYIVPPTEKYLKELKIANSNYVVGIQIPIKK